MMKKVNRVSLVLLILLPVLTFAQVWVNSDSIGVKMKDYGEIEIFGPVIPGDSTKQIDRITMLVGVAQHAVFDYYEDADEDVAAMAVASPTLSDMEGFTSINNFYSLSPPDVLVSISPYSWDSAEFVIVKAVVENTGRASFNARIGLDVISQIAGDYDGIHTWLPTSNTIDMSREGENHMGLKFLSHTMTSLSQFIWFSDYSAAGTDSSLWNWMTATEIDTVAICTNPDDGLVSIPATDPISIGPNQSVDFYYCVARGQTQAAMEANIAAAEAQALTSFGIVVDVADERIQPAEFSLAQNFPNPFNPSTEISYALPEAGPVSLKIFNLRGELVRTLHNGWMSAGAHTLTLDASELASGIYMYSLTSGSTQISRKMTLLK